MGPRAIRDAAKVWMASTQGEDLALVAFRCIACLDVLVCFKRKSRDNCKTMAKRSHFDESGEAYNYWALLKSREWREKSKIMIAKSPRCQKCGRTARRFAVHHRYYECGRLPWDYPDEAYMVVCNGRCHREADEERKDEERMAENDDRLGWQTELGKKEQKPKEKELRRLAKYEAAFKSWLSRKEIPPESWDWNNEMYPLWWFWNQFADEFLAERKDYRQTLLDI